jgi:hypothetical protein
MEVQGRRKNMSKTLSIKELKVSPRTLEMKFSQDVEDLPLEGKHFSVHDFSGRKSKAKLVHLAPNPGIHGATVRFNLEEELQPGDVVVAGFSHSIPAEEVERIGKLAGVEKIDLNLHQDAVLGAEGNADGEAAAAEFPEFYEAHDVCEKPGQVAWERVVRAAEALKKDRAFEGYIPNLEKLMAALKQANECEENRDTILQKLYYRFQEMRPALEEHPEIRDKLEDFCRAVWQLLQSWETQDQPRIAVMQMLNLLLLAKERFEKFVERDENLPPSAFCGPSNIRTVNKNVPGIIEIIKKQYLVTREMSLALETCARTEVVSRTKRELLRLQAESEEACCSLLCEFQTSQDWYRMDYAEELTTLFGEGTHSIAQVRAILEQLSFDPLGPWKQFSARLAKIKAYVEQMKQHILKFNPQMEGNSLTEAQGSLEKILTVTEAMASQSSALQTITTASCGLVVKFRSWAVQIEEQVDVLLCKKTLDRCNVRSGLVQISSLVVQIFCFLVYVERECQRFKEQQRLTPPPPPPLPSPIKVAVGSLPENTTGMQIEFPPELVELFKTRSNANVRLIDPSTNKLLEIVPATADTTTLAVTADAGTIVEVQAYADGDLVGTVFATAS